MNGIIELDLHGKTQYQAKIAIDAALRRADRSVHAVRIIHGYHGGTALRDMVSEQYASHPKVKRLNKITAGITELIINEL